jgi:lactoylglutathione lyase
LARLVHDAPKSEAAPGSGISHLVVQVESLDAALAGLSVKGIAARPPGRSGGAAGPRTSWIIDPDGYRIELVQWPAGHADGITGHRPETAPAALHCRR